MKPRADVTRSPKQGYQWPHQKDLCPPKNVLKEEKCLMYWFFPFTLQQQDLQVSSSRVLQGYIEIMRNPDDGYCKVSGIVINVQQGQQYSNHHGDVSPWNPFWMWFDLITPVLCDLSVLCGNWIRSDGNNKQWKFQRLQIWGLKLFFKNLLMVFWCLYLFKIWSAKSLCDVMFSRIIVL